MNDTIIQVKNLVIAFGDFKAVNDISFEVRRGEIFGFLGANGAGKTTTIRTLCGILNPTSGQVFVNGTDVAASISVLKPVGIFNLLEIFIDLDCLHTKLFGLFLIQIRSHL